MSLRPDLARIAANVPAGARVLDVGCGSGDLAVLVSRFQVGDGEAGATRRTRAA